MATKSTWLIDTLFLSLCIGVLFFLFAGSRPLLAPDEGRYAEIAREMVFSGDYITPYLNGIKYFEKPILFYWLEAGAIKAFGLSIWSLRSVNVLLGLFGCLATYFCTRTLYDRATGLLAALILATSMLYFAMAHMISLDLTVTVFLSLCLYAFLLAVQVPAHRRAYMWSAAATSALAVLTKGLIGVVFPGMIIFCWLAVTGEWRLLKRLYIPSSLVIFTLLAVPWHILVNARNPEFFDFYFITQHVLRYTMKDVGHYQPAWFFIPSLFLGFFPWIIFLPQTLMASLPRSWAARHSWHKELFFLLWAVLIFSFFSFSKSKLIPYILPVVPPLAVLTARYLRTLQPKTSAKVSYIFLVGVALVFAYVLHSFTHYSRLPDSKFAQDILWWASVILVGGTLSSCVMSFYNIRNAVVLTLMTASLFLVTTIASIPAVDTRSILPLATLLKARLKPGDSVITYNQYYQDLPFYLQRRVSILNWHNEMTFGMEHQDAREWMLDDEAFMRQWHSLPVYAIMREREFEGFKRLHPGENIQILGSTVTNILITNGISSH